jgi:hydroxyethylthiazole kinase
MNREFIHSLSTVKTVNPVVHCITNYVTVTDVANSLLAIGASPIMSHAKKDFLELLKIIKATKGSLVLNIGTLDDTRISQMIEAGKVANKLGVPVVLDPVGAGATEYRTESALKILNELRIDVVKGNESEIQALLGQSQETRGVDAIETDIDKVELVKRAAKMCDCIVAVTGKVDYISDSETVVVIKNGSSDLGKITGTGCMVAGLIGAFLCNENKLLATSYAIALMAIAGELSSHDSKGPGSFRTNLFDYLANINEINIKDMAKIETI